MRLIYSLGGATLQARVYFIATAVRRSHSFLWILMRQPTTERVDVER